MSKSAGDLWDTSVNGGENGGVSAKRGQRGEENQI